MPTRSLITDRMYNLFDLARWKDVIFIQKIFIYFCVMSIAGQVYEWIFWGTQSDTLIPFAQPYGFGAVAVIAIVYPLVKKKRIRLWYSYWLCVLISTVVEYLCALCVVLMYGRSVFWDYTGKLLSINGYVCLESVLVFGLLSMTFIYWVYPYTEKKLNDANRIAVNVLFTCSLLVIAITSAFIAIHRLNLLF